MDFVSFHTHTTYSYGDGYGPVSDHVNRVADLGMSALGISEHGNVNSHAAIERECCKRDIKPIFGVEAYFGPVGDNKTRRKYHITLFARDDEGYRNLNRIVSQSWIDSYQYPTVSPRTLKKYAKGIVAFSGCADSLVSCTLLGGKLLGEKRLSYTSSDYRKTRRRIEWFQSIFEDRFYLEVQRFKGLERACVLNPAFAELGAECGVPLIATADVHYPFHWQNKMQTTLHAARRGSTVEVTDANWEYDILLTYPESDEEIHADLVGTGLTEDQARTAILNTASLAQQCTVELPKARRFRFPEVHAVESKKPEQASAVTLKKWIRKGWKRRVAQRPNLKERKQEYSQRINTEFKVIADKDFCDYFLMVADLVTFAKSQNISVGPGRGSAAGSVICYLLGITEIDPLHPAFNRMLFERFIDPTRSDMPDIDLDFDDEKRHLVVKYATKKYGKENVCSVANHTKYRAKNTLQNVARAYGLYENAFKAIAKRAPERTETDEFVDTTIQDTIESYSDSPDVAKLISEHGDKLRQACQLEGNEYGMGIHAGGFIISSEPITDICAIYTKDKGTGRKRETVQVIPYEKRDAEHLGMLKVDLLGLTTMGMLGLTRQWTGMSLEDMYVMFYKHWDDQDPMYERIMSKFQNDDITGIFQYEGGTTREVTRKVKPGNFDELAACNALSRPGPFYGGQTKEYIAVKNGDHDWKRIHPNYDKHVAWTNGQIVYQEQIMFILRDFAGFDISTVLRVRKIIGKKLGEHQFAALWEQFRDGVATTSGIDSDNAAQIWSSITTAAGYAFNVAHAYSYGLIAYWQSYFSLTSKASFYAASLAKNGDGKDDLPRRVALLQDAQRKGLNLGEFDPDRSGINWEPGDHGVSIYPGFIQMPGIAEATAQDIIAWREKYYEDDYKAMAPPIEWYHLINVSGIGEGTIMKMVEFSLLEDPFGIKRTSDQLEAFRKELSSGDYQRHGLPGEDLFRTSLELDSTEGTGTSSTVAFVGFVANIVERDEIESIRQRTGKPVSEIRAEVDAKGKPGEYKKATLFAYDEFGEVALRVSRWRYDGLSSRIQAIESDHHIVVAYGKVYSEKSNSIQLSNLWILEPD